MNLKKVRVPLPDPHSSFTHSCNSLASYEPKRNPKPKKQESLVGHTSKMSATPSEHG